MAEREVKVVLRGQDELTGTLTRGRRALSDFRESSEVAGRGLGRLTNVFVDLSREALGVPPIVARLGEKLAEFGLGGGFVAAASAAIGGLSAIFLALSANTRKAQEAYDAYRASLSKSTPLAIIGAQLDEVQHKLDNMGEGFLGAATRFTRGVLSRSLLGQLFGVKSREELLAEAAQLTAEADAKIAETHDVAVAKFAAKAREREAQRVKDIAGFTGGFDLKAVDTTAGPAAPIGIRREGVNDLLPTPDRITEVNDGLSRMNLIVADLEEGFARMGDTVGQSFEEALASGQGFLGSLEAVRRNLGKQARVEGAHDAVAAISAFGRGLFGDPTQFAAAAQLAASSAAWFALSATLGTGGGSGATGRVTSGGSGGLSPGGFEQNAESTGRQGTLTINVPVFPPGDPAWVDWFTATYNEAQGRRIIVTTAPGFAG